MLTLLTAACLSLGFALGDAPPPASPPSWFVLLESGVGDQPMTPEQAATRQAEHIGNLVRLYEEGKSALAGPLGDGGKIRGIVMVEASDEAALADEFREDPFVVHGHLSVRAARLEGLVGRLGKPESKEMGTYVIALLHPDVDMTDDLARSAVADITEGVRAADDDRLLAYGGALAGDDDLVGVMLFLSDDTERVETLLDDVIGDDVPITGRVYAQYLGKGILEGHGLAEATESREPGALARRVAVIGASVSNGFGSGLPLAAAIEAAIEVEHADVLDATSATFFANPEGAAEAQVDACLERDATLVVGVDVLFWFAHGLPVSPEEELERRLASLELGLALLDRLDCPLAIGDIPDMTGADERLLIPKLIPSPDVRAALNERIAEWAASRPHVLLLPTSEWVETMRAGEWRYVTDDGTERTVSVTEAMLPDGLHPRPMGVLLLTDRAIDLFHEHFGVAAEGLDLDLPHALKQLKDSR